MASAIVAATPSQWAAATMHLENRDQWVTIRIEGVRFVIVTSGTSGRVYGLPVDASSCPCKWNTETRTQCSHMLALELAATMDELAEDAAVPTLVSLRSLYPPCMGGCGSVLDSSTQSWCDDCAAIRERSERMAAARRRVIEEWAS